MVPLAPDGWFAASAVLILDDIETVNTIPAMKKVTDPDALLLQGAADPTRLAILRELAGGERSAPATSPPAARSPSRRSATISRCCASPAGCAVERRGSWVYYWLRPEAVARFRAIAGELSPVAVPPQGRVLPVLQPSA